MKDLHEIHPSFLQKNGSNLKKKELMKGSSSGSASSGGCGGSSGSSGSSSKSSSSVPPPVVSCSCKPPVPNGGSSSSGSGSSSSSGGDCEKKPKDPYGPGSASSSASFRSGMACKDPKATNALGRIGPTEYNITEPPYEVVSCDQVLVIEGFTFPDPADYSQLKKAVFTMSVYMINEFEELNGKAMKNHILVENITELPELIHGAPRCLDFIDNKNMNKITICFSNTRYAEQAKEAFGNFMKCRMGDNLKDAKKESLQKIFKKACLGKYMDSLDKSNEAKVMAFLAPFLPKQDKKKPLNYKGEFNPAYGLRIPGSPDPQPQQNKNDKKTRNHH